MITRLLLALDDTPASHEARRLAIALAKANQARLGAIAVIDTPWITRPMATGIGGSAYKVQMEMDALRRAHQQSAAALAALRAAAAEAGVACEARQQEGEPAGCIEAEATTSDLLVLGRNATFFGEEPESGVSETVLGLLERNPRPLLLAPERPLASDSILVAFDGSLPASRSLHMLALLGLAAGRQVRVLSIAEEAGLAVARAQAAAALLRAHGAVAEPAAVTSSADPAELIMGQAQASGAGIVAMGAYGHRGLREIFFGSCTRRLLQECGAALFVHH